MKTSAVEVSELVSTMSAAGVQRQLDALAGVHHADVNYVAGSATVHDDEAKVTLEAIRQRMIDCGYQCRGSGEQAVFGDAGGGDNFNHVRLAQSEGAGLVEDCARCTRTCGGRSATT